MAEQKQEQETKKTGKKKRSVFHRIVNVFLYFLLGLFTVLIIAFGISQTSFFKNWLKDFVTEQVNTALNGKLSIGKIEGTIFTSLYIRNPVLTLEGDTLLNIESIEVRTSPLQLLRKRIFIRKFELRNGKIELIRNEDGTLNISNLVPPSEEDTTTSEFPFTIEASEISLNNVDFHMQNRALKGSRERYDTLNMNDFRLNDLNLSLRAYADIDANEYEAEINSFNVASNINGFELKDFTGNFSVDSSLIEAGGLEIITGRSNVSLSASLKAYNIFDSTAVFGNSTLDFQLEADKFNFADLQTFVPSMDMLNGEIYASLNTEGPINSLDVNELLIEMTDSRLSTEGRILNLASGSLYIDADLSGSYISQNDIAQLLPEMNLPQYPELGLIQFDTLRYKGEPLDFGTDISISTDRGKLRLNGKLNFEGEQMRYDARFATNNLNIAPFAGIETDLNSRGRVNGSGTDPQALTADIVFNASGSTIYGNKFDTLNFNAQAESKIITFELDAVVDTAAAELAGLFNFENEDQPAYTLKGFVNNINMADFSSDSAFSSDIYMTLDLEGSGFDPDRMNLFASLLLSNSSINGVMIDSTRAIVDLRYEDDGSRVINIISDLADITFTGKFGITETLELMQSEAELVSNAIDEKLRELTFIRETENQEETASAIAVKNKTPVIFPQIDSTISIDYSVEFKDFDLLSIFLGNNQFEVDGYLTGEVRSTGDSLVITSNTTLEYLKYWGKEEVFFLTELELKNKIANSLKADSLEDIAASITLDTKRLFMGNELKNLAFSLELENKIADLDFYLEYENLAHARFLGMVDLTGRMIELDIDSLNLRYEEFDVVNKGPLKFAYSGDNIIIEQFVLLHDPGTISVEGALAREGQQDLRIIIDNLRGQSLSTKLFGLRPENSIIASINMDSRIRGNFADPDIDFDLKIDSITYKNKNFGTLLGNLDYRRENLKVDIRFIDSAEVRENADLIIAGTLPVNLALTGAEQRLINSRQVDLSIDAREFNLGAFGDLLPAVNRLRGILSAGVTVGGTFDKLLPEGYLALRNSAFVVEANNLEYNAGLKVSLTEDEIVLDSLLIANVPGTQLGGKMTGSGKAEHNNLQITSSNFAVNGQLKVLDDISKSASPSVYGDLVVATRGNIEFQMNEERNYLVAPVTIKTADLTFPPTQSAYQNTSDKFIYKFVQDTIRQPEELSFQQLIKLSKERSRSDEASAVKSLPFDFSVDVVVEDEASIIFILSKELNQNLTAVLEGNFKYESINERVRAAGELQLLEESTLKFLTKTFIADGTVKFENELTNPYLDITATYRDYYYPAGDTVAAANEEEEVAVKIKIKGALEDLGKNLLQEENNIAVYRGAENIESDQPDPTLTATDAVMFILTGNFTTGASQADQNMVNSYAASLAGSLVGGFLNNQLGEYVRTVELRQVGATTKFNVVGKAGEFRYSIGGSTDVFQDISHANIKIEYPVLRKLFLRLERKEAITETNITNEMINELGLRYKFEF